MSDAEKNADAANEAPKYAIRHTKSPQYLVHPATGATVTEIPTGTPRLEISFYADRVEYIEEELEPVEGDTRVGPDGGIQQAFRTCGKVKTNGSREHLVGINLSIETAEQVITVLSDVIDRQRAKQPENDESANG